MLFDLCRRFHQRIEHRLQIEGRAADDLEHVGGRGLLLQGFTQFVEQSRVLDCDDGLVGEARDQCDLLVGKGTNLLTVNEPISSSSFSIGTRTDVRTPPSSKAATASGSLRSM